MPPIKDIAGQRFGRLTAVRRVETTHREARWLLKCDCGGETVTTGAKVRSGYTQSCGCILREVTGRRSFKHGESNAGGVRDHTRLYNIWNRMRQRCSNPNATRFHLWGGRGIQVCPEWGDYQAFKGWAISNGYAPHLTIDRIDNDKGYSPDNCRWATYSEQRLNQRRMKA